MNIRQQLVRINLLSLGAAFALILIVLLAKDFLDLRDFTTQHLATQARLIGSNSTAALSFGDERAAEEVLSSLSEIQNVMQGTVFTREGRAFARYTRPGIPLPALDLPPQEGILLEPWRILLREPIRLKGEVIGHVVLSYDTTPFLIRLVTETLLLATIIAAGLFVATVLFSQLQIGISSPILRLSEVMQSVSERKDYSLRVPVTGEGEVAILGEKFNEMITVTQEWSKEIVAHRANLEQLVEKRTAQWQDTNRHLEAELVERKRTEEELRRKTRELATVSEDLSRALTAEKRFVATMSHEVRTPLNAVIGFLDVLAATHLDEYQQKLLGSVRTSSQHLLSLICDVLDVSKIDSGQLELRLEPLDLATLLEECTSLISSRVKAGVTFRYEIPQFDFSVLGDGLRLKQIFLNLLGNATKFTEQGQVRLSLAEKKDLPDNQVYLVFCVEDTGIGIPPDQIPHLFQPFRQLNAGRFEGTGLGLFISAALAKLMHGSMAVQSQPGRGTQVYLTLTLERGPSLRHPSRSPQPVSQPVRDLHPLRLLVVEDMELNVQVIREILRTFFTITDITVAANGLEAVEKLKTGSFDLVLMDIQMPGMDGIEATRAIRADGNGVPIVAMSAHAFLDEIERARQAGMNDYLTKPVQRDHLDKLFRTLFPHPPGGPAPASPGRPEAGSMEARIFQYFLATFDSREIADRLLRKTLESLHACSGELEKRIAGKDLPGLEATLHRVHGALLNCGLPDLGELAGHLHQRTRQGSVDLGGPELARLVTALKNPPPSSPE